MSTVKVNENESVESAIKRFKRKCQKDGIIGDIRKHVQYEKPSVTAKKKQKAAIKRNKKAKQLLKKDHRDMVFYFFNLYL